LKVNDKNSVFVIDFHRTVSLVAAPQLLCESCSPMFMSQPTKTSFTQGWRELSVQSRRISTEK